MLYLLFSAERCTHDVLTEEKIVMNGLGFAVLLYVTVAEEVEAGAVKVIHYNETFEPMYAHLLTKQSKWSLPVIRAFQEIVLEQFMTS